MRTLHQLGVRAAGATALAGVLALAGCWNNDDDLPPLQVASNDVPDSAGASIGAFFTYILSLQGSDEGSEPFTIKDSFAVPVDESSEPTALP